MEWRYLLSTDDAYHHIESIRKGLKQREPHLRNNLVSPILDAVAHVVEDKTNIGRPWDKRANNAFYQKFGATDRDGNLLLSEKELFQVDVSLGYILRLLHKRGLKVTYWPKVRLCNRQYLAIEYDDNIFPSLWRYEKLLQSLLSRKPNFSTNHEELCARLILSAIGIDGIVVNNADGKLAALHTSDTILDNDLYAISIVTGKGKRPKQYFLGKYSTLCLKILIQRSRKHRPIFPENWQMKSSGHHKSHRRRILEEFLSDLWQATFPRENVPKNLNVPFWIQASHLSLMLGGLPALALAHLRHRFSGAQLPHRNDDLPEKSLSQQANRDSNILSELQALLPDRLDNRIKSKLHDNKTRLSDSLERMKRTWQQEGKCSHNEKVLIDWLIWMVSNPRFENLTLSTFQGYVSTVANRVFPIPDQKNIDSLTKEDWESIGQRVAENQEYAPSSRRTAITHLRRLNEYLVEQQKAPHVLFSQKRFQVSREIAECNIPFPHEVDELLAKCPNEELWIAIVCSFYLGMRCEEICHLNALDFEANSRLVIRVSKIPSSCRTIPYAQLIPEHILNDLNRLLSKRRERIHTILIGDSNLGLPMNPDLLSKQVGRMLRREAFSTHKMHALRHGFASWQLVRYYMLVDSRFRQDTQSGRFHHCLDARHPWFSDETSLADLAEIFGGAPWRRRVERGEACLPNATDLVVLSKLLGHANRFTTLENYTNSLGWICRYFLRRRESQLIETTFARRS